MELQSVENHSSLRMTRFYLEIVGMWYAENKRDRLISNAVLTYTVTTMVIAVIIIGTDFIFSWGDLHALSYNAPCTTTVTIELLKLLVFVYNRERVMEFNAFTEKTFWKKKYEALDLEILNAINDQTIKVIGLLAFLMQVVAWHYLSLPLFESMGKNATERILPFNMWFNLPFKETPYYEVAYGLQVTAAVSVAICATTFAAFLFTVCMYATGQFKILSRRLQLCCDNYSTILNDDCDEKNEKILNDERATFDDLKECIIHHQMLIRYMDSVEHLYCYIMLGEALGAVLQICFSGFQVVLGAEESLQRTALSLEFLGAAAAILYLFSWACQEIIDSSMDVAEGAYNAAWYNLPNHKWGRSYKISLLITVARSRRPCVLTVGKFTPMSLETFTSVCSTSISYFTILRQMNEENQ